MRPRHRLAVAFGVDRSDNGVNLATNKTIWLEDTNKLELQKFQIAVSPRIGISRAQDHLLRFFVDGNRYVSGCARCHSRPINQSFIPDLEM